MEKQEFLIVEIFEKYPRKEMEKLFSENEQELEYKKEYTDIIEMQSLYAVNVLHEDKASYPYIYESIPYTAEDAAEKREQALNKFKELDRHSYMKLTDEYIVARGYALLEDTADDAGAYEYNELNKEYCIAWSRYHGSNNPYPWHNSYENNLLILQHLKNVGYQYSNELEELNKALAADAAISNEPTEEEIVIWITDHNFFNIGKNGKSKIKYRLEEYEERDTLLHLWETSGEIYFADGLYYSAGLSASTTFYAIDEELEPINTTYFYSLEDAKAAFEELDKDSFLKVFKDDTMKAHGYILEELLLSEHDRVLQDHGIIKETYFHGDNNTLNKRWKKYRDYLESDEVECKDPNEYDY